MSWLPNPFKSLQLPDHEESSSDADGVTGRGSVKEDLSVIGETIGRQFRGVAAFLAPPPTPPATDEESSDTRSPRFDGIRNDLAEIGGSFKSSFSLFSSNKAVIEISKLASNFLQLNEEQGEEEMVMKEENHGVGFTDEFVGFVTEISDRPECWTDFPLSLNYDDFTISDAQSEHISAMEKLVPTLAHLRTELSTELSEKQFLMIYFILILPRLNENSLNLLSTPEIVEARSTLLTMLQRKRNLMVSDVTEDHIDDSSLPKKVHEEHLSGEKVAVAETSGTSERRSEEKDANTDAIDSPRHFQNENDFSFSDLEDDDTDVSTRQYGSGRGQDTGCSSPDGSSEWVRLNESSESGRRRSREGQTSSRNRDSEGEESSGWLNIDDYN